MIKTFTQNDLIRYLYHETTEQESQEINQALLAEPELQQQFQQLCAATQALDEAQLNPSSQTVLNILSYIRSKEPVAKSK